MVDKVRALLEWCKAQCKGYANVTISNFTTSWKSGLAFCAIIHRFRPDLINYDGLQANDTYNNCKLAFDKAYQLGIPALLDAEDMVSMSIPDRLSIITYVSQYYNVLSKISSKVNGQKNLARPAEKELPNPLPSKISKEQPCLTVSQSKKQTLEDKCCKCGKKVYLLQRQLSNGKLFHRHCVREMSQQAILERSQQVNSIKSASHVPDTSIQEREKAREIIMKNMNILIPRLDSSKKHHGQENVLSTSDKEPLKLPNASSNCPIRHLDNTDSKVDSIEIPSFTRGQSFMNFQNSSPSFETHKISFKRNSKLELPNALKQHVNLSANTQPLSLTPSKEQNKIKTSESTTYSTKSRRDSFLKPLKSRMPSPNHTNTHTSSTSIIDNENEKTNKKTSLNNNFEKQTETSKVDSPTSKSESMYLSKLYSKVNKNKTKVVEANGENGKTEWQLEVERRMKMRNGVYHDPEFRGIKKQNHLYDEIEGSSDQHQHTDTPDSLYSRASFLNSNNNAYDRIPVDYVCDSRNLNEDKTNLELIVPSAIQLSNPKSNTNSTTSGYTNPIYVSNISSHINVKKSQNLYPINEQDRNGSLRQMVRKPDDKRHTPQKNTTANKPPSTPVSPSITSFHSLSNPTTPKQTSSLFQFPTISPQPKRPPIHSNTKVSTYSNNETRLKSHYYTSPKPSLIPLDIKTDLPVIKSNIKSPFTSQPLPTISSSLPDRYTSPTSSLPPLPHTIPPSSSMSIRETILTSSNIKEAANKGVFRSDSKKDLNCELSYSQTDQQSSKIKRDYIDLSKYKPQATNVSRRKVSTEVHISYKEIENNIDRLIEEMLMIEEKGRELEEAIRNDKEEDNSVMHQWLELVRRRNDLIRRELDLKNKRKLQEFDELHENLEYQLRLLIAVPETGKSPGDMHYEEFLIRELQKIVDLRNQIIDSIEHDREKYQQEDEHLHFWTHDIKLEKSSEKKKGNKVKRFFSKKSSFKKEKNGKEKDQSVKKKKKIKSTK